LVYSARRGRWSGLTACELLLAADRRAGGLASRSVKPFQAGSETGPTKLKPERPSLGAAAVVGLTCPGA
jgi:hypothetical protein